MNQIARRLLTLTSPPLLPALEKLAKVEIVAFGGKSQGTNAALLPQVVAAPPVSLQPGSSDLSEPLTAALSGSEGESLLGVIMLTDGRDNGGHDPTGVAARLASVLDTGEVRLERDGLGQRLPARVGLIALDEGLDDDEQLPQALRERLAFRIEAEALRGLCELALMPETV